MQASTLFVTLTPSTLTGAPGDLLQFSGTITNTTNATVFLNADGFNLTGLDSSAIDDTPFFVNAPLFLDPNASTANIGLINISIPLGFTLGNYGGTFQIFGGATADDQTLIGSVDFTAQVQAASGVPEPSSFSLLALSGTLLTLGYYRKKRRQLATAAAPTRTT